MSCCRCDCCKCRLIRLIRQIIAESGGGQDGITPNIGENGNWWIGDIDTGVSANGADGISPDIGDNGTWWIGDIDTGISAQGPAGEPGPRGEQGLQGVDGAQGIQGENGIDGASLHVLGSFNSYEELIAAHPTGNPGDSWFADGYLYVWNETSNQWDNVGYLRGPQGIQGIQGVQGVQGATGPKGDTGAQGPIGITPTLNYISAIHNQQTTYNSGDLLRFEMPTSFARNGITLTSSNTFTLTSKTTYEISLCIEVLTVVSGQPRIELLVNGTLLSPPQLNARANGWHSYDIILNVPANATIQFRVTNGSFTTTADFSGVVHSLTIKSLN